MARGATITVENNFTRGLITEFTAMNFPENAVTEADNVVFSELGKVTRRLGLNAEVGFAQRGLQNLNNGFALGGDEAFTEFRWQSVDQEGSITFLVQQIGSILRFFSADQEGALSTSLAPFSVDLADFRIPPSNR